MLRFLEHQNLLTLSRNNLGVFNFCLSCRLLACSGGKEKASTVTALCALTVNLTVCYNGSASILDLTLESLDRSIMESGLTYDHGHTRNGSQICASSIVCDRADGCVTELMDV